MIKDYSGWLIGICLTILGVGLSKLIIPGEYFVFVGILGIFFTIIINLFVKSKKYKDIFPSLNKDALEKWGAKWGQQFNHLKKVVLYEAPMKYPTDVKYILFFSFDNSTEEGKRSAQIILETSVFIDDAILGKGFEEIYKKEPNAQFREDWLLLTDKDPDLNDKYSWVIYKK